MRPPDKCLVPLLVIFALFPCALLLIYLRVHGTVFPYLLSQPAHEAHALLVSENGNVKDFRKNGLEAYLAAYFPRILTDRVNTAGFMEDPPGSVLREDTYGYLLVYTLCQGSELLIDALFYYSFLEIALYCMGRRHWVGFVLISVLICFLLLPMVAISDRSRLRFEQVKQMLRIFMYFSPFLIHGKSFYRSVFPNRKKRLIFTLPAMVVLAVLHIAHAGYLLTEVQWKFLAVAYTLFFLTPGAILEWRTWKKTRSNIAEDMIWNLPLFALAGYGLPNYDTFAGIIVETFAGHKTTFMRVLLWHLMSVFAQTLCIFGTIAVSSGDAGAGILIAMVVQLFSCLTVALELFRFEPFGVDFWISVVWVAFWETYRDSYMVMTLPWVVAAMWHYHQTAGFKT